MKTFYAQYYLEGGDIYDALAAEYGTAGANIVQAAALTGDATQVQTAISDLHSAKISGRTAGQVAGYYAQHADMSTASNLVQQIYNEPFNAPIAQAQNVLSNTVNAAGDAVKKTISQTAGNIGVWIIGAVVVVALFFYFGGGAVVRSKIKSKA